MAIYGKVEIVFTVLNRLRGTWSWFAKVIGVSLGIAFYFYTNDIHTSIALSVSYILGESMGWGKWIGGVYNKYELPATQEMIDDQEGMNNGIHFLANKIAPEEINYYRYCFTALNIRGIYWFLITMLPLVVGGYLQINDYVALSLLLGYGFPLSVKLGAWVENKRDEVGTDKYWVYAEFWYGLMQDLAFASILILMHTNT